MAKIKLGNVKGPKGEQGVRGSKWYNTDKITGESTSGTAFPNSGIADAMVGDMALNPTTLNLYTCQTAGNAATAKWAFMACIKGPQGEQGPKGDPTTVDAALSATSTNPVQNRVVNQKFQDVEDSLDKHPLAGARYFTMRTTRARITFKSNGGHNSAFIFSSGNGVTWLAAVAMSSSGVSVQKLGDVMFEKTSVDTITMTSKQWAQCVIIPISGTVDIASI